MKFGIIAIPFKNMRLGASVTSPTWTSLTDEWQEYMTAEFLRGINLQAVPSEFFRTRCVHPGVLAQALPILSEHSD